MKLDAFENIFVRARMRALGWTHWRGFVRAARRPKRTQERLLLDLVHRNRKTAFGREHNFGEITSYQDYAAAVPVQTYETLRPYIERQQKNGEQALTAAAPVLYAQTSGTTASPKLIPLLDETLAGHKRTQATQSYALFCAEPEVFLGRILGIVSPAVEGHLDSGLPFGSASGHVSRSMPRRARARYVLPEEVLAIDDYELKYQVIVSLALACPDITCIATANPSTLLKLMSVFREHRESLLRDITRGECSWADRLTSAQLAVILPRLACSPERTSELESLLRIENPSIADIWPRLRLISTWTGGSCGIALEAVKQVLPPTVRIAELGYMSSEFRGTVTVHEDSNAGAPTIEQNFFEFVEQDAWDSGQPRFLTVDALEDGRQYYIIVTTSGGLYRYFMNDIVEASGRFESTPCIRFIQKGTGVTNITGEKLHESQVIGAVRSAEKELGRASVFFVMLADVQRARYHLFVEWPEATSIQVERLRDGIERELLSRNIEYAQKRESGRLGRLVVTPAAAGTGHAYKLHCIAQGQREVQYKVVALQTADSCSFEFADFTVDVGQG